MRRCYDKFSLPTTISFVSKQKPHQTQEKKATTLHRALQSSTHASNVPESVQFTQRKISSDSGFARQNPCSCLPPSSTHMLLHERKYLLEAEKAAICSQFYKHECLINMADNETKKGRAAGAVNFTVANLQALTCSV